MLKIPHRTYCDALHEIRQLIKCTNLWNYRKNLSVIESLTEELQVYGNRMEAGLAYTRDLHELHKRRNEIFNQIYEPCPSTKFKTLDELIANEQER